MGFSLQIVSQIFTICFRCCGFVDFSLNGDDKKAIFCLDWHQYAREVSEIKIIWTFYKIGQAGGRTSLSLIFSLTSSALDHSATTPPSLKEYYDFVGLNPGRH